MIKVCHYLDSVGDGGAETLVKDYALHIDKNKYDFYIIVNKLNLKSANYLTLRNKKVKIISIYKKWNIFTRGFNHFFGYKYIPYKLKKIITKIKPNIIHIHHDQLTNINHIKNLPNNIKLFYTCHNIPELHLKKAGPEYLSAKYLINKRQLRIIALHNNMKKELENHLDCHDVIVLNNGIDFNRFINTGNDKEKILKDFDIPEDAFVIGCVARFVKDKNHSFLIDIFKEVILLQPNSYLLLIGDGPLKQETINKLIKYGLLNNTIILEHRNDIENILKMIDVYMLVSFNEGFSISLIEAQRMGIKCVCSNQACADTDNILTNKTFSLSLDEPITKWRDTVLDDKLVNDKYFNIDDYNIENVVRKLEKLYEESN